MNHILKSPIVIGLVAILALMLSVLGLYRQINYSDFSLDLKASSLVFNLKNNRYIEITPLNDHVVSIFGSRTVNPFKNSDSNTLNTSGLDIGPFNRQYNYTSISEIGSRQISIARTDAQTMSLEFDIRTSYEAEKYRYYTVQLDYSGLPQVYPISRGMRLIDNGCTLDLTDNQTAAYDTYNNDKTILINIPYSPVMKFKLNMKITCNQ